MIFWCLQISQNANQILDNFLPYEARAEIRQYLIGFLGDLKAPKNHSEINWPLEKPSPDVTDHTSWVQNNVCQKCEDMGLNGFHL